MSGGHTQKKKKKRRSVDCGREDEKIALQKNSRAGSCCCSSHGLLIIDDSICTGGPLNQDYVTFRDPSRRLCHPPNYCWLHSVHAGHPSG